MLGEDRARDCGPGAGGDASRTAARVRWADISDSGSPRHEVTGDERWPRNTFSVSSLSSVSCLSSVSNNFPVQEQTPARASASAAARVGECLIVSVAIHRAGGICYSDAAVSDAVYSRLMRGPAVSGDCVCPLPPFTFQDISAVSKQQQQAHTCALTL